MMNDQSRRLKCRSPLLWLGTAALILPAPLAACVDLIPSRQLEWPQSRPSTPPRPETRYAARLGYRWRGDYYEAVPR